MGKKCPLKTVALAVDEKEKAIESSQGRAQSWWRPSQVWEARVECRWHGKVAWKSNEDKTPTKWKTSTNEDKWIRRVTTTKWTKASTGSLKQVPSLGVFDYFMVILWLFMIICYYKMIIYDYFIIILWFEIFSEFYGVKFLICDYLMVIDNYLQLLIMIYDYLWFI